MKRQLTEDMKPDFMCYAIERRDKQPLDRHLNYLTEAILSSTFDYFVKHKLTVHDNAKSYWYKGGERQDECLGYSGSDVGFRDDMDGIVNNLFHEVWCKAEWIARGKGSWYEDVCKQAIGASDFMKICA